MIGRAEATAVGVPKTTVIDICSGKKFFTNSSVAMLAIAALYLIDVQAYIA